MPVFVGEVRIPTLTVLSILIRGALGLRQKSPVAEQVLNILVDCTTWRGASIV